MSVRYEFISLFIPVQVFAVKLGITKKIAYPSQERRSDGKLLRIGAMNGMDIETKIDKLERLGLIGLQETNGIKSWKDFCIVDELSGLDIPCDWIKLDKKNKLASLIKKKLYAKMDTTVKKSINTGSDRGRHLQHGPRAQVQEHPQMQSTSPKLGLPAIQDVERPKKRVEIVIGNLDDSLTDLISVEVGNAFGTWYEPSVKSFTCGEEMLEYASSGAGDIFIIVLNNLPFLSALSFEERMEKSLQLVTQIRTTLGKPVIVLSGARDEHYLKKGKLAADFFLQLPFLLEAFTESVRKCLNMLPGIIFRR